MVNVLKVGLHFSERNHYLWLIHESTFQDREFNGLLCFTSEQKTSSLLPDLIQNCKVIAAATLERKVNDQPAAQQNLLVSFEF